MRTLTAFAAALSVLALSTTAYAATPEEFIAAKKCNKCHTEKTTKKGPSYAELADKNKADAGAAARMLNTLKTGGKEDHDKITGTDEELKAVIAYVLAKK